MTWMELVRDVVLAVTLLLFMLWLTLFAPDPPDDDDSHESRWGW